MLEEVVFSEMSKWENDSKPPIAVTRRLGSEGILAAICGVAWPRDFLPAEVNAKEPENFDHFHELIGEAPFFPSFLLSFFLAVS